MPEADRNPQVIRVFTEEDNHRIRYALHVVFTAVLGMEVELVGAPVEAHVIYGTLGAERALHIQPCGLLQHGVMLDHPQETTWDDQVVPFPSGGDLPFDLFAAAFYLTSRMEEYTDAERDAYGRFTSVQSWLSRHGLLDQPVVDQWAIKLKSVLSGRFPELVWPGRRFKLTSTVDIDSAYAYLGKGLHRTLGGFVKDILRGDWKNLRQRRRVIFGGDADPFDTYARIQDLHSRYPVSLLYFALLADFRPPHDISLPWQSARLTTLLKELAKLFPVGIHPGFHAAEDEAALGREIARLAQILEGGVENGRYHYLRGRFPDAFSRLEHVGIRNDYTMAFPDAPGFRLGTCTPVPFYDLKDEVVSSVILHPTAMMDTTFAVHSDLDPRQALDAVQPLVDAVRAVQGEFICLWHNETWSEFRHWEGWSDFPEEIFKRAFPAS